MHFQFIPYLWLLIISAAMSLALGIYTMVQQKSTKGIKIFTLSMFVVTIWSAGNALEIASVDFSTKLFWANVQYIAYCYSPVTLLALCMEFTGYDQWIKSKRIMWLAVLPTIILALVWTDGWHNLIRYDLQMDYSGAFPVIAKKYGPVFYVHAFYSHCLNILAWILFIRAVFIKNTVYRKQALAILFGLSLIIIPNLLYISGLSPVKRFDITPIFFGPAGFIIIWGIFRFKLFDVVPLARTTVIENMGVGFMVLDLQNRVLDINPAFEKIVDCTASMAAAQPVEKVCQKVPALLKVCEKSISHSDFSICDNNAPKVYEVLYSPLIDNKRQLIGRLVVTYDITEIKKAEQEYMKQQRKLAITEERERLARDMHDNLAQLLGFINFQAQGIRQELTNNGIEIASYQLDRLVTVSQSAHNQIRKYIHKARYTETEDYDFFAALKRDLLIFEQQSEIKVKLDLPADFIQEKLNPSTHVNILNIVKEALNNISKHAAATSVNISFSLSEEHLCVAVHDNGKGFGVQQFQHNDTKFGLGIMRERALEIGAQIKIESTLGQGSTVRLWVPYERERISANETHAG